MAHLSASYAEQELTGPLGCSRKGPDRNLLGIEHDKEDRECKCGFEGRIYLPESISLTFDDINDLLD